jgi:hypothetical protein
MQDVFTSFLNLTGLAWWVEIQTHEPDCIYYFGPFSSPKEAESCQHGYIEDLTLEGAKNIQVKIKRCKPSQLTIEAGVQTVDPVISALAS